MERTIVAHFDTRREAETAVEHLVQEHGIDRTDVFIRAPGKANTAGVRPAGADVESGHPGVEKLMLFRTASLWLAHDHECARGARSGRRRL